MCSNRFETLNEQNQYIFLIADDGTRTGVLKIPCARVKTFCTLPPDICRSLVCSVGRDGVVGTATCYGLNVPGIESRVGDIFRSRPDRPGGPTNPSTVYNGYRVVFPGVKWSGGGVDHLPPSSGEVKERVDLYFCSSSRPSWSVLG